MQELLSEYRTRTAYDVRQQFLAPAIERANEALLENGQEPMIGVTPHSLRRTFVSLLLVAKADVPYVMHQVGHTNPKMTLGIYAQVIDTATDHGKALDGPVSAAEKADKGSQARKWRSRRSKLPPPRCGKPRRSGAFLRSG